LSLERLSRQAGTGDGAIRYADHQQFPLHDFLQLPVPPKDGDDKIEEADIEGLDCHGGYLWLAGSHSLKRDKPKEENAIEKNTERLAKVSRDGNRFLLARIPLSDDATPSLKRTVERDGHSRTAARLAGNQKNNALTRVLGGDEHLGPFLAIPSKDNGLDIEGLAVAGDRVFVGLRGPVLRGWAAILELALEEQDASTLTLKPIGPDGRPYRKHFLDLRGSRHARPVRARRRFAGSGGSDNGANRIANDFSLAGRSTARAGIAGVRREPTGRSRRSRRHRLRTGGRHRAV
jgi:hypothetical protein